MEVDPVILQLRADNDRYLSELRRTTRTAEQQLGLQERRVKALETQMSRSSGAIGNSLRSLGAVFAGALSARALVNLSDGFTRLQNNLKVAGLEGENLAAVQANLLDISQRYGASVEGLSGVFLKASLAQNELGASTADIIQLNEIIAASLKVTGTSAQEAQGALLQLGQALGSGVVRAEEFNSILEGALPLAQAAARGIDGFGGSVSRLRAAIAEGEITSQQFFEGVLRGGVQTIEDAERATLTLSGGFEALSSALTVYFGEADKANGVSAAMGEALNSIAENLDVLIPAIAAVTVALGVRYVAAVGQAIAANVALAASSNGAAASMGTMGAATFALQARLAGAATTTEALTFAMGGLGIALPIAVLGTFSAAMFYMATQTESAVEKVERLSNAARQAEQTAEQYEEALRAAGVSIGGAGDAAESAGGQVDVLSRSMDSARGSAQSLIAELERLGVTQRAARIAEIDSDIARGRRRQADADRQRGPRGSKTQAKQGNSNAGALAELQRERDALTRQIGAILIGNQTGVDVTGTGGTSPAPAPSSTPSRSKSGSTKPSGPDPADLLRQFEDELVANRIRLISAQIDLATSAEEEARLRREQVTLAEQQTLASIAADEDLTDAQREQLRLQVEAIANAEREAIFAEERRQIARDAQDLADERYDAEREALRLQFDLATTDADRRDIALRILDAEDEYLRAKLQATIANQDLADIERQRAQMALDALNGTSGARREATRRQYAGPLERYAENAGDVDARVEEATVRQIKHMNGVIVDAISSELGVKDPFLRELFSIFLDENIFGPLAQALGQQGSGGGGLFSAIGTALGSLFGGARATGGPVSSGKAYLVGERGPELFMPNGAGNIVPNQRLAASTSQNGGVATVRLQLSGDIDARIDQRSTTIAVEVVRDASGPIINASAAETTRRLTRRTL